jgi:DNA mismatch repair protein MutL
MESIIKLLPDAIANQIAAGEVVQRPASVVKELLENAIDAKSSRIELTVKDAGKTLIQVMDNGAGMSAMDARMSFERHATSKIKTKEDLFNIRTLGFRGEALASIAAVAQVKLRTKVPQAELGTEIEIEGSEIKKQQACTTPTGTLFQVKNLFFNVPARRNFLKANQVEMRHVLNEFIRVAIPNPQITFICRNNESIILDLQAGTLAQRITAVAGSDLRGNLLPVEERTGYVKISGFIGSPSITRKNRDEQFFFVNGRFIKSPFLHHAITTAYTEMLPKDCFPFYCIFLEIDPIHVDINIHPTKTEVKFDDENTLYALINGAVKKHLGNYHAAPEIELDDKNLKKQIYQSPVPSFITDSPSIKDFSTPSHKKPQSYFSQKDWENLYRPSVNADISTTNLPPIEVEKPNILFHQEEENTHQLDFLQPFGSAYLVISYNQQLFIIDKQAAQERVLYERFLETQQGVQLKGQQLLFTKTFEFSPTDKMILLNAAEELLNLGMELKDFSGNAVIIYSSPPEIPVANIKEVLDGIVQEVKLMGSTKVRTQLLEKLAKIMAIRGAYQTNKVSSQMEIQFLSFSRNPQRYFG